jgi:hypothetical protein
MTTAGIFSMPTGLETHQSQTAASYREVEMTYDHFNEQLFGGKLPRCVFTFQRQANTMAYFVVERFALGSSVESRVEIVINPEYFAVVPIVQAAMALVHEAAHIWQWRFGNPSRRGYHNRQWAQKMEEIGLMPSDTGRAGGRKVGQKIGAYPLVGGRFLAACDALATEDFRAAWLARFSVDGPPGRLGSTNRYPPAHPVFQLRRPNRARTKFTCEECQANAWGKPTLRIVCILCDRLMTAI